MNEVAQKIVTIDTENPTPLFAGSSCAFGVFDGLHVGHDYLLTCAKNSARDTAIALTFDIDPDELFARDKLKKILSNEQRLRALSNKGVDYVAVLPFTYAFAALSPLDFLERVFAQGAPAAMHVGSDFRFGARNAGTTETLMSWGNAHGMEVFAHDLKSAEGKPVSATRIRLLLRAGDVSHANELLGRPYFVTGFVEHGRHAGADYGFSTANMMIDPFFAVLGPGVYAGWTSVDDTWYRSAICVGIPPTFDGVAKHNLEIHILDFDGDLYGRRITTAFAYKLRDLVAFGSEAELIATVKRNIESVDGTLDVPQAKLAEIAPLL